jgi:hypothetical protein
MKEMRSRIRRGKRILREMRSQRGKNKKMSKGKESRSESRDRRKLNEAETLKREWLRVESESERCKNCSPKGQMLCMQKLKFESLV